MATSLSSDRYPLDRSRLSLSRIYGTEVERVLLLLGDEEAAAF